MYNKSIIFIVRRIKSMEIVVHGLSTIIIIIANNKFNG